MGQEWLLCTGIEDGSVIVQQVGGQRGDGLLRRTRPLWSGACWRNRNTVTVALVHVGTATVDLEVGVRDGAIHHGALRVGSDGRLRLLREVLRSFR